MSAAPEEVSAPAQVRRPNVRQAAFIGVGSMVGAGIFALLGAAGEAAGAPGYRWKRAGAGTAKRAQVAPSPMEQG